MKSKGIKSITAVLFAILLIVPLLTMTALAASDNEDEDEINLDEILIPIPIVVTHEHNSQALTPPGNLTLVDDEAIETTDSKQFMTVTSKNGNVFYIIIDRDGNTENVHFLNLVDEMDLLALLEDDVELPEKPQPEPYIPPQAQETEPETTPEPESNGNGRVMALIVFLMLGGIGAGVYFKIIKPKQAANNSGNFTSLEEFDTDNEYDGSDDEDNDTSNDEEYSDDEPEEEEDKIISEDFNSDDEDDDEDSGEYI